MVKYERIFLTGFMTSGKSTIGSILANGLGWNFYDLDKEIEALKGKKVAQIFEEEGEEAFRKLESEMLRDISRGKNVVIALGGGTIATLENLSFCKTNGTLIYLKVEETELLRRLKKKVDRPLFKDLVLSGASEEKISQKIKYLLKEREKFYNQADIVFKTGTSSVGKTVDELAKILRRYFREKNQSKRTDKNIQR